MPNKYRISYILADNFEAIDESPMRLDEIEGEVTPDPTMGLTISNLEVEKLEE